MPRGSTHGYAEKHVSLRLMLECPGALYPQISIHYECKKTQNGYVHLAPFPYVLQ